MSIESVDGRWPRMSLPVGTYSLLKRRHVTSYPFGTICCARGVLPGSFWIPYLLLWILPFRDTLSVNPLWRLSPRKCSLVNINIVLLQPDNVIITGLLMEERSLHFALAHLFTLVIPCLAAGGPKARPGSSPFLSFLFPLSSGWMSCIESSPGWRGFCRELSANRVKLLVYPQTWPIFFSFHNVGHC